MAVTTVTQILSGVDLVPHVEMGALRYAMRRFSMAPRVLTLADMTGWNVRKVSEYKRVRSAQQLDEATDIPTSQVARKRLAEIEPNEWGDRYPITDRRADTDPEAIIADTIEFLGYSLGVNKEQLLMATATAAGPDKLDASSAEFAIEYPIELQHEFQKRVGGPQGSAPLYCVIHPFQARDVLKTLVQFSGSTAQANLAFRERAIAGWNVPGFDNMNIAVSEWVPRKLIHKVNISATGGTFRLEIGTKKEQGVNITADITYNATPATMYGNIATALNALTGQSGWQASGASNDDLTVTAPIYLDAESELRVAVDADGDDYNALTGGAGTIVVSEREGGLAVAPVFQRNAIVHDVRKAVRGYQELVNQGRTLEISAYETFGVGLWQADRIMQIETLAESVFAVA